MLLVPRSLFKIDRRSPMEHLRRSRDSFWAAYATICMFSSPARKNEILLCVTHITFDNINEAIDLKSTISPRSETIARGQEQ